MSKRKIRAAKYKQGDRVYVTIARGRHYGTVARASTTFSVAGDLRYFIVFDAHDVRTEKYDTWPERLVHKVHVETMAKKTATKDVVKSVEESFTAYSLYREMENRMQSIKNTFEDSGTCPMIEVVDHLNGCLIEMVKFEVLGKRLLKLLTGKDDHE